MVAKLSMIAISCDGEETTHLAGCTKIGSQWTERDLVFFSPHVGGNFGFGILKEGERSSMIEVTSRANSSNCEGML